MRPFYLDLRTENREQRAESRQRKAESKEQTESREHFAARILRFSTLNKNLTIPENTTL